MPTTNIFFTSRTQKQNLQALISKLKIFLAEKLTCGEIALNENEISIRLIEVKEGSSMIGSVEVEVTAFAFPERVKQQDRICLQIREFIKKQQPSLGDVKVWLILAEFGHSWE